LVKSAALATQRGKVWPTAAARVVAWRMEMPVLRHDVEPGSPPPRISQSVGARYGAEPDYPLQCLPQPGARSSNFLRFL